MRNKRRILLIAALVSTTLTVNFLSIQRAQALTSQAEGNDLAAILFDPVKVSSITLNMSNADFESLKYPNVSWDNEGDWRKTTMRIVVAGKTYGPYSVGVHLKGAWGSWRDVNGKAAFKVKMDAFVAGQRLFGLSKLTLNNMVQDPSYIHEFMTYKLMRSAGVPAPRTGYANVTLNGINYGLHLNVETVDKRMLKRWGVSSDHIYKGSLPYFPDLEPGAEWQFKVEAGNPPDLSDLTAITETNRLTGESWFNQMNRLFDLEKLTLLWATEFYANHWDGYMMNKNNYFINFDDEGKAMMIPWGADQTWGGSPGYFSFPTLMPNRCMSSPSCTKLYYQALTKVSLVAGGINLDKLGEQVSSAIYQAVLADPWGPRSGALANQRQAIQQHLFRLEELNTLVTPWDTSIKSVTVNNLKFSYAPLIYLKPGTRLARVSSITRQLDASTTVTELAFRPGSNKVTITVVSADSNFTTQYPIDFYVLTQKTSSTELSFTRSGSKLNLSSNRSFVKLTSQIKQAKVVKLTVTRSVADSASLAERRANAVREYLTKAGVSNLWIDMKVGKVTKDRLKLSVEYQY